MNAFRRKLPGSIFVSILLFGLSLRVRPASVIGVKLDDPQAVYLTASEFGAHADGSSDDSAAIQAAIDKAETNAREGIVFVPSGRYRLTHTVYVWPGVRIFG